MASATVATSVSTGAAAAAPTATATVRATPAVAAPGATPAPAAAADGTAVVCANNHFTYSPPEGENGRMLHTCKHCGTVLTMRDYSVRCLLNHVAGCGSTPEAVRKALDDRAKKEAEAKEGKYRNTTVYKEFEVLGWMRCKCKRCHKIIRNATASLKGHGKKCSGTPPTWEPVDPRPHFVRFPDDTDPKSRRRQCLHCKKTVRMLPNDVANLKIHMGHCGALPADVRRAMDACAVAQARARVGAYGRNPVYLHFEVTGWRVFKCRGCDMVLRGDAGALAKHVVRRCPSRAGARAAEGAQVATSASRAAPRAAATTAAAAAPSVQSHVWAVAVPKAAATSAAATQPAAVAAAAAASAATAQASVNAQARAKPGAAQPPVTAEAMNEALRMRYGGRAATRPASDANSTAAAPPPKKAAVTRAVRA